MSESKPDGGPAFPVPESVDAEAFRGVCGSLAHEINSSSGMSLRDWFAGMALQGIMVNGEPEDVIHNTIVAYRNADALIDQRQKQ